MNNENKPSIYEQSELYRKMYGDKYNASKSGDFYNPPRISSRSSIGKTSRARTGKTSRARTSSYVDYTYYGDYFSSSDCSDSSSYCD